MLRVGFNLKKSPKNRGFFHALPYFSARQALKARVGFNLKKGFNKKPFFNEDCSILRNIFCKKTISYVSNEN